MKYNNLIVSLAAALLLAANPAKAQTNEVQLDVDGIMRVCAPVPIVTIGNSITAGYSNTCSETRNACHLCPAPHEWQMGMDRPQRFPLE